MLAWRYWLAAAIAMAAALALTAACRVEPGAPPAPAAQLTVPPPATATPAPTATATPTPPAPTAAAVPTLTLTPPPLTYVLINPTLLPESCAPNGYCGSFTLGGRLTAATWLDADRMYLADFDGNIRLLNIATGATETVLSGLTVPRGLTVLDGRLYVSDLGNLCAVIEELPGSDAEIAWCSLFDQDQDLERYLEVIKRVSTRIMSYRIDQDGSLSRPQIVLDRVVTTQVEHGPNGLVNDGEWIYASIGDPGAYFQDYREMAPELAAIGIRIELLGTIIRFRPGDADVEIWATGFRNTYGISIAPDGVIYGADNDAADSNNADCPGCHKEELNAIVRGGYYGYPDYGTNAAPPEAKVIEPVAVLQGNASTFAHANAEGVYVAYLTLDGAKDRFVVDRFDYDTWQPEQVFKGKAHTTAILERNGLLYLATFDGYVHIINPKNGAPVALKRNPFQTDEYVAQVIAALAPRAISPGYAVYINDGRLIYAKDPCSPADREARFFLHLTPEHQDDIPPQRRRHGYDNLDFDFADYGWQSGSGCYVARELPLYDISAISTGQYIPGGPRTWEAEFQLER